MVRLAVNLSHLPDEPAGVAKNTMAISVGQGILCALHRRGPFLVVALPLFLCNRARAIEPTESIEPAELPLSAADREHWAFRPLVRPPLPAVKNVRWSQTPVDLFILAKIEAAGLAPAPSADRTT